MALSVAVPASVSLWFRLTIDNTTGSQFSMVSPRTRPCSRHLVGIDPINLP